MPRPKKNKESNEETKPESYQVKIKTLAKEYFGSGDSVISAISNVSVGQDKPSGRAIITVSRGDKKKERIMLPIMVQRLFNLSRITREIQLKNISLLFDL